MYSTIVQILSSNIILQFHHGVYNSELHRRFHIHNHIHFSNSTSRSKSTIPTAEVTTRLSRLPCPQTPSTSGTNQRAPPEHVVSAAVTSATCARMLPHDNQTGTCHSVQVLSDSKVKHTSQRHHESFYLHLLHYPPPPAQTCSKQGANALTT